MPLLYYLAYGSNLHPMRMTQRVPSARFIGKVEMRGRQLAFHKHSNDGSGKCLLYSEQGDDQVAHGVLYEINGSEKAALDRAEGVGKGYVEQQFMIPCPHLSGPDYIAFSYGAQSTHINPGLVPFDWYKTYVLAGATYHGMPAEYIEAIRATPSKIDLDTERSRKNWECLARMGWKRV